MARIRKVHRICETRKENRENNSDSEIENLPKSSRFTIFSNRKIKLIGRTRRVYQNFKNCTDNFNHISDLTIMNKKTLSCSILSTSKERNWIHYDSKFTQTSEKDVMQYAVRKISNSSTQTEPLAKDANIMEMEMIELDTLSLSINPGSVKSQLDNSTSLKADMEKEHETSEGILSRSSKNGTIEMKIPLKNSITEDANRNIHKNGKMTPSKIPIPLKYLPKTKCDEIKQLRKKKRNSLKKKSRKLMNFHNVKNIVENVEHSSIYERKLSLCDEFFNKMKKYIEIATDWSMRILKFFSDLGISLKSLNNIYELYDAQTSHYLTFCECDRYRQEVIMLGCKMKELESQIKSLSAKTLEKSDNAEKYKEIFNKLNKIDRDVQSFVSLKTEVAILKKHFEEKSEPSKTSMPPFPPPPPPPPLPPPPSSCYTTTFMKVRQDDRKLSRFNESRPIITLEDILKVKLKKISVMDI